MPVLLPETLHDRATFLHQQVLFLMIKTGWTGKAVLKYTLLQIPAALLVALLLWLLRIKTGLDLWVVWAIIIIWVAKDVVLFFFLWPAYDNEHADYYGLKGLQGKVVKSLAPGGTIKVRGQTWKARSELPQSIPAGSTVRVVEQHGLTLVVRQEEAPGPGTGTSAHGQRALKGEKTDGSTA